MGDKLFNNLAAFTDIHFGNKNNSKTHNEDCIDFIKWFVDEAKQRDCDTCIFLGDWHHDRARIGITTLQYSLKGLELLNSAFEKVFIITGNHDLFYKEKRDVHSMILGKHLDNIHLIDEPTTINDVALIPWLVEDEWKKVIKTKCKYMFGHFEIPNFKLNQNIIMPHHGTIDQSQFHIPEYVFSGHFHCRQNSGNIYYIGNPFGHTFADSWDFDRGAMFFSWDGEPEFVNWEDGPKFLTTFTTELLNNTESYPLNKSYIKSIIDVDLSHDELMFVKELLESHYGIRDLKFIPNHDDISEIEYGDNIEFQSIDQLILDQLSSLDLGSYDKNLLIKIYNGI